MGSGVQRIGYVDFNPFCPGPLRQESADQQARLITSKGRGEAKFLGAHDEGHGTTGLKKYENRLSLEGCPEPLRDYHNIPHDVRWLQSRKDEVPRRQQPGVTQSHQAP